MGIFDKFSKNKKTENKEIAEPSAMGWDAITAEFERIYPDQTNPKHYGTLIKWALGGKDPLDGISIYDGGDYWHFVTYGMTELYEKEEDNNEISGFGYEMTFKLKKDNYADEEGELKCICGILQAIARITFNNSEIFQPFEFLYTGQTTGIDAYQKSNITGFICVPDTSVNTIDTPNGRVAFLTFIGMTDAELKTLDTVQSVKDIYARLGSDITDYNRESLV